MAFKLYTDKTMQNEAWTLLYNYRGKGSVDTLLYFGSPNPNEILTAEEGEQITLTPVNLATEWKPNQVYYIGQIIVNRSGLMYRCTKAASGGATEPAWWKVGIGNIGKATFMYLGDMFRHTDIKLALNKKGLDTAKGGEGINLGEQLQGGVAVPIYIRDTNNSYDNRDDKTGVCRGLELNKTIITTDYYYYDD